MPLHVCTMPNTASIALGVLVNAGTRDENWPEEAGIAHAFEHMVFQGNTRMKNSQAIAEEIESEGGNLNAFTDNELTFYYRVIPDHAFDVGVRSLAGQLRGSLFRNRDIENEMKNVLQEISRANDNSADTCMRSMSNVIYGDHPLSRDVLGIAEKVENFDKDNFLSWKERFYHPKNYIIVVAGNIDLQEALKIINRVPFGSSKDKKKNCRGVDGQITQELSKQVIEKDIEQAVTFMGVAIGSSSDPSTEALDLFSNMIGGGMSYPLFQEVRDKRGLCYSIESDISAQTDRSLFYICVGTNKERIGEAVDCIKEVIWNNKDNQELFKKAKKMILGKLAISLCTPATILVRAMLDISIFGTPKSPEQIKKQIEVITLEEVSAAVERYLYPENFSYAHVVPLGTKIDILV